MTFTFSDNKNDLIVWRMRAWYGGDRIRDEWGDASEIGAVVGVRLWF